MLRSLQSSFVDKSAQSLRSNSDQKSLGRKKLAQKKRNGDTIMSNTSLASLNVDVLLYLIKFIDPVDRLNLVFSGILKGFENVSREIGFQKRYFKHFFFDVMELI
jgi:hypothetical protein